ncbi:MAG TPA: methyl-accepting chemotaxis protein [Salinivirga sp.]|uniref:methyl-accepting chemotaxis protein n=1 Tax=Salinivirga sp. TaxID=1970192 RepID=UPI002B4A29D4|nr:methyl-accepting chemotaxis protein [Salinivirga sp.]HKK59437.1 methyl-accepting chemotaxis protein [Salinivirga sp.]
MKWKNLKLGRKFFVAFGIVLLLLAVVAFWAINGIGGIVSNAGEVIEGNKLRTEMNEKYVQHLQWAGDVAQLLTDDNVTELHVQTDDHQCAFGKWYYGEGRKHAEELAPELKPIFDQFEEPHKALHNSAVKIKNVFQQASTKLSAKLRQTKSDHLNWAHKLKDYIIEGEAVSSVKVVKNHEICKFGKWYYSDEMDQFKQNHPGFASIARKVEKPHELLHNSVYEFEKYIKNGQFNQASKYYSNVIEPLASEVLELIDEMIAWNYERLAGMQKANRIYVQETEVHLDEMGTLFTRVINESENYLMTDEVMLQEASQTRSGVIVFSILALIAGIVLATIIALGIIRPINKGVVFADKISKGNLTAEIDVDQDDEIGQLARALQNMANKLKEIVDNIMLGAENIASASQQMSSSSQEMSQGASEQASSAEEVSSSMEEMASNIQQNTDNANETEKISLKASEDINEGNKAVSNTVVSMRDIADKIGIISEIARQTNILALNAAVEAARAGEHGKGFAVVAEEVRKLAARSQEAAKDIEETSKSSVDIAEKSGKMLEQIVPDIQKTAKLVQEITAANNEMTGGAGQVNNAIQQLNQVTQQNAAASEELATSSEELSSQADELKNEVAYFDTGKKVSVKRKINKQKTAKKPANTQNKTQDSRKTDNKPKPDNHGTGFDLKLDDDNEFENF